MSNTIHPTAIVGKNVQMGQGNDIGPGCVLEDGAALGHRNRLWMNVYVGPGTTLGDENQLHMGAVIGHLPQDLAFAGGTTFTRIGSGNTIREYVTIHRGTKEGTATVIGDDNFFMANAHVGHNGHIGSRAILANLATLAGYCAVEHEAFLSGMVAVHQFSRIGRLAMVGGLSVVIKDVPPYMLGAGRPVIIRGLNVVGMRRAGVAPAIRQEIKRAYRLLYREGLNVTHAVEAIERECRSAEVAAMVAFIKASKRGICAGIGAEGDIEQEETLLPRKSPTALNRA